MSYKKVHTGYGLSVKNYETLIEHSLRLCYNQASSLAKILCLWRSYSWPHWCTCGCLL